MPVYDDVLLILCRRDFRGGVLLSDHECRDTQEKPSCVSPGAGRSGAEVRMDLC